MSGIFVHGIGAVSPAGWGAPDLCNALEKNLPLPLKHPTWPCQDKPLRNRTAPAPASRPAFISHPRLRRATEIAQYSVAAALEAIGGDLAQIQSGALRAGIIVATLNGCVNYSRRFYEEILANPSAASPLIFPETVFNSPASHLGAFLGSNAVSYTLVGDDGTFLQGLALAAQWLLGNKTDACVVVGAEESDWVISDALSLFQREAIHAGGAGALYLKKCPANSMARLAAVTDAFSFMYGQSRPQAARKMRAQMPPPAEHELLCTSVQNISRLDAAENAAWEDWVGSRLSPKTILGEAFTASGAWQCVAACEAIRRGNFAAANVSAVGLNQQAIGARFQTPSVP
ncbi:MAG: hypothetical protein ACLQSR_15295 [Limisphaerales bacterium]